MTRPRDWEPLHDGDPIPGDPYEVARLGKKLRGMADEIEKQAGNIKALASVEGWDSDAGRAFHEIADGTSGRLKRAFDRYDEAAKALGTKVVDGGESKEYASELHRAQKIADKALSDFREAEGEHKSALSGLDQYRDTVPSKDDVTDRTRLVKKRDAAWNVIRECHSEIGRAKIIRDDAAKAAAQHIKNIIHHDGVRDPGGFMNWLADWADMFANLSAVFSVLAVICAFVPPLQFLAPVFAGLAIVTSAMALAGHVYDMTVRGGEFNGVKLFFDTLGVIPGVGALKGFTALKGLKGLSRLRGLRFSGAAAMGGVRFKFFNGVAVTAVNFVLTKAGKAAIPGEKITAAIKGGSFVNAMVKVFTGHNGERTGDPGDHPRVTPSPSPQAPPRPASAPFHAALAH
ncbi:putative T7SS-secreted protein [Streptomyces sp. NPDC102462]|uniref:putative T7SS-secreted protein n=1 Tax=Streptomyces sp. NPDC102462 TaxID=3366178 RepID=UPI0037F767CE